MNRQIIYVGLMLTFIGAIGQKKIKYSAELPGILGQPTSGRTLLFKEYQRLDPENYSIDLQLAVIYEDRYRNSDILTDYVYKYGNAVKALEYYNKAAGRIDEKETKKNTDNYLNFGTYDAKGKLIVPFDSIRMRFEKAIPELSQFVEKAPPIYEAFTVSYSHYDKAHKLYTALAGKYATFNELILLYDASVEKQFEEMVKEYELALSSFDQYKKASANYNIPYNQKLNIRRINTYRLDGFSAEINFLLPSIDVWDYATWVKETRVYIKENIDVLRKNLLTENKRINTALSSIGDDYGAGKFKPLEISKEVMFNLRRFDLTSVIEPIFLYKQSMHDILHQNLINQDMQSNVGIDADRKLFMQAQMLGKLRQADTLLTRINTRNTDETHARYADFLSSQYGGKVGITNWTASEKSGISQEYVDYVYDIRQLAIQQLTKSQTSRLVESVYRKIKIPLMPVDIPALGTTSKEPVTTHRLINFDQSMFVAGIKKAESGNQDVGFVAGITADGKTARYREISILTESQNQFDTHVAKLSLIPGGCALLLHGISSDKEIHANQLILLSESGEDRWSGLMPVTDYPRLMNYSDRSNTIQLAFKGLDVDDDIALNSKMTVMSLNVSGEVLWSFQNEYRGSVFALTAVLDGFLVYGNYNVIRDGNGALKRVKGGPKNTNLFVMKLDAQGKQIALKTLDNEDSFVSQHIYRVTDDCINIFGQKAIFGEPIDLNVENDRLVHLIISRDLDIYYTSLP